MNAKELFLAGCPEVAFNLTGLARSNMLTFASFLGLRGRGMINGMIVTKDILVSQIHLKPVILGNNNNMKR